MERRPRLARQKGVWMRLKTTNAAEGYAKLVVPAQSFKDPHHVEVFYNPRMALNRSLSSLALGCGLPLVEGGEILDGLCSTGARGIRYLKENKGVGRVTFCEANPAAVKLLKRNLSLNKIPSRKSDIWEGDLSTSLLREYRRFDFVELDPFGSPVFYLDAAVKRLKRKAIFSVTATDLANLCGVRPKPALRHYDARAFKTEYCHELALRILVGRIARTAAMLDFSTKPLLSFFEGHAAKCVAFMEKSAPAADECLRSIGFVSHCPKCLHRESGRWPLQKCLECGGRTEQIGPLWLGKLCDSKFLECLSKENAVRHYKEKAEIFKLLSLLGAEDGLPVGFYDLHVMAQKAGVRAPPKEKVLEGLRASGFKAVAAHYAPQAVKTDAGVREVEKAVRAGAGT